MSKIFIGMIDGADLHASNGVNNSGFGVQVDTCLEGGVDVLNSLLANKQNPDCLLIRYNDDITIAYDFTTKTILNLGLYDAWERSYVNLFRVCQEILDKVTEYHIDIQGKGFYCKAGHRDDNYWNFHVEELPMYDYAMTDMEYNAFQLSFNRYISYLNSLGFTIAL